MNAVYLIIALPLAGFGLNLLAGRKLGDPLAGWLATLASGGAFVSAVVVWVSLLGRSGAHRSLDKQMFSWISVAGFHVDFALRVDPLSITMALFVTGVGSLIHLYSIGYMRDDPGFPRFFVYLNLFLFSMLCLVLADNFLFMFLGWEGVGFCSYALVGFWFDRETAAVAAKKAFVTNRVGDVGFMLAIFVIFFHFGSLSFSQVLGGYSGGHTVGLLAGHAGAIPGGTATAICLLLLLGAVGKSAQLPLYMWLPDAMEGPTPVSALIHAATMVTAGVYLMARIAPLLHYSHSAQWTVAIVGATTAAFAATIACVQNDIKRVLAYSTISQLGYMFLGVGSGGYTSGLFHMIMHAFFKALLFLAAGSVIHSLHDEQDMKRMGGLYRYMKVTAVTFMIGWLSISGIPPFSGFWSKDDILANAWHMNKGLWIVGALTAGLTAYYMTRQVVLVFFGKSRWQENRPARAHGTEEHAEPHESPPVMRYPLIVLGVLGDHRRDHQPSLSAVQRPRPVPGTGVPDIDRTGAVRADGDQGGAEPHRDRHLPARHRVRAGGVAPGRATGARAVVPPPRVVHRRRRGRDRLGADPERRGRAGLRRRRPRHRRDGRRGDDDGHRQRARAETPANRLRPQLRARHRPGHRRAALLRRPAGGELGVGGWPNLSVLVFLPAAGAVAVALLPKRHERWARLAGIAIALVELGLVVDLVIEFRRGSAGFQFVTQQSWISGLGISWHLGVDGISLFLVAMTALLFPIAIAGPRLSSDPKAFMGWMLLLEAACIGTFVAMDLFVFFIMFEITLVPGYFIIAGWGEGRRRNYAALKFFLYTFAGSAFLFVGILSVWFLVGRQTGVYSFNLITLARDASHLPLADQQLLLCAFAAAFAVKIPLVPFHTWLPDAYTEAPTSGSMILAGILFKLGAYGILRFGVFLFPRAAIDLAPLFLTLAAIGITYGAIVAIVQRNFKRLIAYTSVADVAFIVLGFFAFTSQAVSGGVLAMVNHGLTTGAMFFLVGMLWERRHTFDFRELGGLAKATPVFAGVMLFVVLSAVGLPGLNGFVGEFLVMVGTFLTHRWWAVVAVSGMVTIAILLLWAYQRVFQGPASGGNVHVPDLNWREKGLILPLLVGIVFLGVYPKPFLDRVQPSVAHLLAHVHAVDPSFHVPSSGVSHVTYAVPPGQRVDGVAVTTRAGPPTPPSAAGGSRPGGGR